MVQDVTRKPETLVRSEGGEQQPRAVSPSGTSAVVQQGDASAGVSQADLTRVLKQVTEELEKSGSHLQMEVDSDIGRVIVKILDGSTGQVIRQIPAQELVNLAKQLKGLNGLLVEKHA